MTERTSLEDEFGKTIDLIKHHANLQFAELTVLIAIAGAGIGFIFSATGPHGPVRLLFMFGMAATAACFWVIWESNSFQMWHFMKRAKQLEKDLGYEGYSRLRGMERRWCKPGTWAFRFLYIGLTLFWLVAALGKIPEPIFTDKFGASNPTVERGGRQQAGDRPSP